MIRAALLLAALSLPSASLAVAPAEAPRPERRLVLAYVWDRCAFDDFDSWWHFGTYATEREALADLRAAARRTGLAIRYRIER